MKPGILIVAFLITLSISISAQFVGDGTPKPASTPSSFGKPIFTLKYGLAMPLSNYGTTPKRTNTHQYSDGIMGAKTGFFAEAGFSMNFSNPDKMVGFYYFPIMASYWKTSLDWSKLGGFFTDKAIYTKPVSAIDIGQRYGVVVRPIKDLSMALYYRPGLLIPLDFEITYEDNAAGESFQFTGTMTTGDNAPFLMMSHTPGFSVKYMMATLSFEKYSARPTYDVHYKDTDNGSLPVDVSTTGKIPIKILLVSLALSF